MSATDKSAPLAGVVLAAGATPWQGRANALRQVPNSHPATTMVEHAVGVVGQRCESVFVVTGPGQTLPKLAAQIVRDDVRGHGQLSALSRGLHAAADTGAKLAFVYSVDAAVFSADLIDVLVDEATRVHADIVLPWDGDNHYLAAVYRTELASVVDDLVAAGERTVSALIARVDTQRLVLAHSGSTAEAKATPGQRSLLPAGR